MPNINNKKWVFRLLEGTGFEGPNSGSGDHFKGTKLSSLVRELVQNSMDAHNNKSKPVKIILDLKKVKTKSFNGFKDIWPHIEACRDYQQNYNTTNNLWKLRFQNSIDTYKGNEEVSVLCFHDEQTNGLHGPIDGTPKGAFHAIKAQGLSDKQDGGSGGSFGHGAVAALLYSGIRAVFYYSKVEENPQERFFGKIILQSHKHPALKEDSFTRSFGYYGHEDRNISPLINEEIPSWAKKFREEANLGVGCSVYIPYTFFSKNLFPETIISLIANFYMAFKEKKLEVSVGGKDINFRNIDEIYDEYKIKFESGEENEDIDVEYINECFRSIDTIRYHDESGRQEISGFGTIEWYLRLSNEVKWRKVGISRKIGMLITRKAKYLDQFPGFKYFDMFVCVKGQDGNDILQKLENPQHTEFELSRVDDLPLNDKQKIIKGYRRFTKKIRDVLKQHASSETSDEIIVDELAEIFGELSNDNESNDNQERGLLINIANGPLAKPKKVIGHDIVPGVDGHGSGHQGGDGTKTRGGGQNTGELEVVIPGDGDKNTSGLGKKIQIQNLRIGQVSNNGKKITVFFDPPEIGKFHFNLAKKGEHGSAPILFKGNKKKYEIDIIKKKRTKLEIELIENATEFVLEGFLHEIKN